MAEVQEITITTEATEPPPPPTPSMKKKPRAVKPKPQPAMIADSDLAALASVFAPRNEQKETKFGLSATKDKRTQKVTKVFGNFHWPESFNHCPTDRARYNRMIVEFGSDPKSVGMKALLAKIELGERVTAEIAAGVDVVQKYGLKF